MVIETQTIQHQLDAIFLPLIYAPLKNDTRIECSRPSMLTIPANVSYLHPFRAQGDKAALKAMVKVSWPIHFLEISQRANRCELVSPTSTVGFKKMSGTHFYSPIPHEYVMESDKG